MRYPPLLGRILYVLIILFWLGCMLTWLLKPEATLVWGTGLIITPLLAVINYFLIKKYSSLKPASRKRLNKQYQQQCRQLLTPILKARLLSRLHRHNYRTPWYFFISHHLENDSRLLKQAGFHEVTATRNIERQTRDKPLPLKLWQKSDAIVIALEMVKDSIEQELYLEALLNIVLQYRPRQPLNGIICCKPVDQLGNQDTAIIEQDAAQVRHLIQLTTEMTHQHLPCYMLISNLAALSDINILLEALNDVERDDIFGIIFDLNQYPSFSEEAFEQNFQQLLTQLQTLSTAHIAKARSQEERLAILAAPAQLALLKQSLSLYLQRALTPQDEENSPPLHILFRGLFLLDAAAPSQTFNLINHQIAFQFGQRQQLQKPVKPNLHPLFIKRLFTDYIQPEASLASLHQLNNSRFYLFQIAKLFVPLAITIFILLVLKLNYDFNIKQNNQVLTDIKNYRNDIAKSPYKIENLPNTLKQLSQLRTITLIYRQPRPWWIQNWIPNPGIKKAILGTYQKQLKVLLLPAMVKYLEDELFAYMSLGNELETANRLNLEQAFQSHNPSGWQQIKKYYRKALIKEDHKSPVMLGHLTALVDDLSRIQSLSPKFNPLLVKQAKASIKTINTTAVLYNYLQTHSNFNRFVDVSDELGMAFNQTQHFDKSFSGVLIPTLYTPDSFVKLNLNVNSSLFHNILANNKAVTGGKLTKIEQFNIAQNLRDYYQTQYIRYWQTYINKLTVNTLKKGDLNKRLQLLSSDNSPLSRTLQLISRYTLPGSALPPLKKPGKQPPQTPDPEATQRAMAKRIEARFTAFHRFTQIDKKGKSLLLTLQASFNALDQWLLKSQREKSQGAFFFKAMIAPQPLNPITNLINAGSSLSLAKAYIQQLSQLAQQQVYQATTNYLNQTWRTLVFLPFSQTLSTLYPFSSDSNTDVTMNNFSKFFKTAGQFDQAKKQLLRHFELQDDRLRIPNSNLFSGKYIQTVASIPSLVTRASNIQEGMFGQSSDRPSLSFKLKPMVLSADTIRFKLRFGEYLLSYQHGPKLWQTFNWPDKISGGDIVYSFTSVKNQTLFNSYKGTWALFKLLTDHISFRRTIPVIILQAGTQHISLKLAEKGLSQTALFSPTFFTGFKVPEQLISHQ